MGMFKVEDSMNACKVTDHDYETLRTLGWSDREILEATAVTAQFNFLNRIAGALGVELEPNVKESAS